jgi:hypothetical protein
VRKQLLEGIPVPEVARFIQEEMEEHNHVSRETLVRTLYRYKETAIQPIEYLETRLPQNHAKAMAVVREGLDETVEFKRLYELQMKRIGKLVTVEEKLDNVLFPNLSNEIRIAAELLRSSVETKKTMGIYKEDADPEAPAAADHGLDNAQVELLEKTYDAPGMGKTLRNAESVHRVVSVLRTLTVLSQFEERIEAPPPERTG